MTSRENTRARAWIGGMQTKAQDARNSQRFRAKWRAIGAVRIKNTNKKPLHRLHESSTELVIAKRRWRARWRNAATQFRIERVGRPRQTSHFCLRNLLFAVRMMKSAGERRIESPRNEKSGRAGGRAAGGERRTFDRRPPPRTARLSAALCGHPTDEKKEERRSGGSARNFRTPGRLRTAARSGRRNVFFF